MPTTAIALAGLALAGAGTGMQYSQNRKARREANDLRHEQEAETARLTQERDQAEAVDEGGRAAAEARRRQRATALGNFGRRDTIRTGPRGLLGELGPVYGKKTLLGA